MDDPLQESEDKNKQFRPATQASYDRRHGTEDDPPSGCMDNTRVHILTKLEAWVHCGTPSKIYWLNGQLGTGKTSIAHTLCMRLNAQKKLGASFFCSRSDFKDATRIVPTISTMLAHSNPRFKAAMRKVVATNPDVADLSSLRHLFRSLIVQPMKMATEMNDIVCNVVVIDAIDECSRPWVVESLIRTILDGAADIPIKFLITSRPEDWIKRAFTYVDKPSLLEEFSLDNVAIYDDVQRDVETYITTSLSMIGDDHRYSQHDFQWPPEHELNSLLAQANGLFIYAATAIRYIGQIDASPRKRLTKLTESLLPLPLLDNSYRVVMNEAFYNLLDEEELSSRHDVLAAVACLRTPLPLDSIASLLGMPQDDARLDLSRFHSVIHVPDEDPVAIFHPSFREFLIDPSRCLEHSVDYQQAHQMLAIKCLRFLNTSLRRNICRLHEGPIGTDSHNIEDSTVISGTLRYSCLHWASHLAEMLAGPSADIAPVLDHLWTFVVEHLLHWFECLSALGKLNSGLRSLSKAKEAISKYSEMFSEYAVLFEDAYRCLQMGFEPIKRHCLNAYGSALGWIPTQSRMRQHYAASLECGPQVLAGLTESWGPSELVMRHRAHVSSVALSPDASRVASGSGCYLWIWNASTGEIEHKLEGHTDLVTSVAYSRDGTRLVSASWDTSALIWNAATGEIEAVLEGHTGRVQSVAFSPDGTRIVSGSDDTTVRIWNVVTKGIERVLAGHSSYITSVGFSSDGQRVISGSWDKSIRIWHVDTGHNERRLVGHSSLVWSVAFSRDGTRVVSSSDDATVRIWNVSTGKIERLLEGHSSFVWSVAFSRGTRVVSGSADMSVRIWNGATGEMIHVLKGHSRGVTSVAFSADGKRVASGARDCSVRVWNLTAKDDKERKPKLTEHSGWVQPVAFSLDGRRIVSGSDNSVHIWDAESGKMERTLKGHSNYVTSVGFSFDGQRVVSGSLDNSVRIWNVITGKKERKLKGHTSHVTSVAFSHDGTRVVSGSGDMSVLIWNAITGKKERRLEGHTFFVNSVAFSPDDSRVVSGSSDHTARIWNVRTGETERVLEGHPDAVTSVAFASNGTWVVSGSWDYSVRIWDTVTGSSSLLSEYESSKFSDGSKVMHIIPGRFHLFAPGEQVVSVTRDRDWILADPPCEACSIPTEFRDFDEHAFSGSKVCLTYRTGRIVIIDLTPALSPFDILTASIYSSFESLQLNSTSSISSAFPTFPRLL